MSGIIALLRHDRGPIDRDLLARMTAAQRFRGPDGESVWVEPTHASVGFGHTLHKATLEAEREHQPTTSRHGHFTITADARIDAREDLCAKLRARGIEDAREDATDPDLILQAYEAWGEACVEHLLGDFSFALWDAREQKLFCAVDQLGVKPFFYANRDGVFAASNTLECVRMLPGVSSELNETAVGDFLMFGWYEDRDVTIYADVSRLAPGHCLVVDHDGPRTRRYFRLPDAREQCWASEDDCVAAFRALLGKAVRDRLRVPKAAIYMSGGVDSTLVALHAQRELRKSFADSALDAFTIVYSQLVPDDERRYAQLAADAIGIPVHFIDYDNTRLFDWSGLEPRSEPVFAPCASAWWRDLEAMVPRFPVLLSGWDGDALLLSTLREHWVERVEQRRFTTLLRDLLWYMRRSHALPPIGVRTRWTKYRNKYASRPLPAWLDPKFRERAGLRARWQRRLADEPARGSREWSRHNLGFAAWGRFFTHEDASMTRVPIESRHPLLDLRVIELARGLPAIPWCHDKELLRRSMPELPRTVRERPKTPLRVNPEATLFKARGLQVEGTRWTRGRLGEFVDVPAVSSALERERSTEQLTRLFRAVALGLWLNTARL